MHLLRTHTRTLDEGAAAVDLAQSPADLVYLSFSDNDLAGLCSAWERGRDLYPALRAASLAQLKHPYSVDLYVENTIRHARFVLVRLLGGLDYWRYGVEELARAARAHGFALAIVPGDHRADARLDAASTLPLEDLRRLWGWLCEGGADNLGECLAFLSTRIGRPIGWRDPQPMPAMGVSGAHAREAGSGAPRALIVFYRSLAQSGDTAPIGALADALAARGFAVTAAWVSSLKDEAAAEGVAMLLGAQRPDVIVNTTAFSARADDRASVLDSADAPVLQAALSGSTRQSWKTSGRGLSGADLAMNVVLPELDGRILTRAISFKRESAQAGAAIEFSIARHDPEPSRVDFVADLAQAWARLRRTPPARRRIACILSDYPHKAGRSGHAIGLDTPASVLAIAQDLRSAGYSISDPPDQSELMKRLREDGESASLALCDYRTFFAKLPLELRARILEAWGEPECEAAHGAAFRFKALRLGALVVALQPDRGAARDRRAQYHDADLPPRHSYLAFYFWLREIERVHAMIHCGAHGTLEWLPGKAVALDCDCAPEAALGPLPLVYPFIVNNPGEAAQAKRRLAAVIVSHLTPPLIEAQAHGAAAELETLFDEYSDASTLDPPRAKRLARAILALAAETGLAREAGLQDDEDVDLALRRLDAWICDLKEMRIADGMHVFGRAPDEASRLVLAGLDDDHASRVEDWAGRLAACPQAESRALLHALDGRFVEPGPAGAPSRGRIDVLPTGRNLYGVDPRALPTRTAWEIGRAAAGEVLTRYAQDHGEWPKRIVLDLWGSATMRTGGDDLAQALALIGAKPVWDHGSSRVSGFEIQSCAALGRPRVDVAMRISGLFRDLFPQQIALFDEAVRAIAALDEDEEDNPLAAARRAKARTPVRVFGAQAGAYGVGLQRTLAQGEWSSREELASAYLSAGGHSYSGGEEGAPALEQFMDCVARADAFVHVQDMVDQDVLSSPEFAEHEAGFAAAAASLGAKPALYHLDGSISGAPKVRTLAQEVARALRGRATNPRWLAGRMRHGHCGAADIAEALDNLFAFAALGECVESRQFELLFDAVCADEAVRSFVIDSNPEAARAIADKFEEARRRGFWRSLRNSTDAVLAELRGAR